MTNTLQSLCVRCRCELPPSYVFQIANTLAVLCQACEAVWLLAPESRRIRAISTSIVSEWLERERCEKHVDKLREEEERTALESKVKQANDESLARTASNGETK